MVPAQSKARLVAEMDDTATIRCAAPSRMPAQLKLEAYISEGGTSP